MTIGDLPENYVEQSNLIEGVTDLAEIPKSIRAWKFLSSIEFLTKEIILDVHKIIMEGLIHHTLAGKYRPYNVVVGGRSCPSFLLVPGLMGEWILNMRHWQDLSPKLNHVSFEVIHPFVDGNGRVGRLLMWWHEAKRDEDLTLIEYKNRWDYYKWFPQS